MPPFGAYRGDEPYLFVSYAHKNSDVVYQHIIRLQEAGFRIWFDEGIDPGTDWSDEIAQAIDGATTFLVFISPAAVASRNINGEIKFAESHNKHMICVHITETVLSPGLEMRLGTIQAIMEYRFYDKEKFYSRLIGALPARAREGSVAPSVSGPVPASRPGAVPMPVPRQQPLAAVVAPQQQPQRQPQHLPTQPPGPAPQTTMSASSLSATGAAESARGRAGLAAASAARVAAREPAARMAACLRNVRRVFMVFN
jgi:hypothetical protein